MTRNAVSAAALAAVLGAVVASPAVLGGCEAKVETPTGPGTITFHVHGLAKPEDVTKLQQALEGVGGVEKVKIDPDGNVAVKVQDQAVTTAPKLLQVVSDTGYSGHVGGH
ncbi:MAG: heavy-metal-associated domain-containing protein [Planctomycetota bacterium]|jgi:copper chaperone CopZ